MHEFADINYIFALLSRQLRRLLETGILTEGKLKILIAHIHAIPHVGLNYQFTG